VAGVLARVVDWRNPGQEALDAWAGSELISEAQGRIGHGVGCKNFAKIKVGHFVIVDSWKKCAKRCLRKHGCKYFGWQKKGGSPPKGYTFGTCFLYGHSCHKYSNDLWDLYSIDLYKSKRKAKEARKKAGAVAMLVPPAPATAAAPAPACPPLPTVQAAAPPDTPAWDAGTGPRYCPLAGDLQIGTGTATLEDQGWVITGSGRVGTRAGFDLRGGSIQFKVLLNGVPTGSIGGRFVSALVGLIMPPNGNADFSLSGEYCDGRAPTGPEFCPDVHFLQTNGRSAYSVSMRTSDDATGECYVKNDDDQPCEVSRYFKSDLSPCDSATGAVIDATEEFYVSVLFPESDSLLTMEFIVTLTQGAKTETFRFKDLKDGRVQPGDTDDFLRSKKALHFGSEREGAVVISSLMDRPWVPKKDDCPNDVASLDCARLQVSDLVIQGELVRGDCTECTA
jgi:hypothetical protein